jgi:hypothetical protein
MLYYKSYCHQQEVEYIVQPSIDSETMKINTTSLVVRLRVILHTYIVDDREGAGSAWNFGVGRDRPGTSRNLLL